VNAREDERWALPSYEREYHSIRHSLLIDSPLYYDLRSREALDDLFRGLPPSAEVFEFGVGLGKNIAMLQRKAGYDISEFARTFSRKRGIRVFDSMDAVPDAGFDVVLSSHVLEHLPDPYHNLTLLRSKLRPRGQLILVLPVEQHGRVPFAVDLNQHLYAWNFRTINNLLQRTGYRVTSNRYRYGAAHYKLRLLGKLSFPLFRLNTQLLGRLFNRRELVVTAERAEADCAPGPAR
jgi:SAM-dependent methyltransferase